MEKLLKIYKGTMVICGLVGAAAVAGTVLLAVWARSPLAILTGVIAAANLVIVVEFGRRSRRFPVYGDLIARGERRIEQFAAAKGHSPRSTAAYLTIMIREELLPGAVVDREAGMLLMPEDGLPPAARKKRKR